MQFGLHDGFFLFFGKVVWWWWMNEVEKPKVLFFWWKNIFNQLGRDLRLLRSCGLNWTWKWERKTLIRDCIHWSSFLKCFFYLQCGLKKWQSPFRLQRKAAALSVSVLLYWILCPTEGGPKGDPAQFLFVPPAGLRDVPLAGRKPWLCACYTPYLSF